MVEKKKSPPALGPPGWRGSSLRLLSLERSPEFTIITLASQEKSIWRCPPPPLWNQECKLHASHLYFGHCFAFSVGFSQSSCRWGGWWSAVYLVWCQEQHQFLGSSSRLYTSFYLLGTKIVYPACGKACRWSCRALLSLNILPERTNSHRHYIQQGMNGGWTGNTFPLGFKFH